MTKTITAYKGFNSDWTCRDFQYEIGKSYEHEGAIEACEAGFHACEHPLSVFNYYPPNRSKFALVKSSGELDHDLNGDTKVAASEITITAELQLSELIDAAVKYVFDAAKCLKKSSATKSNQAASATGDQGAASATGRPGRALGKEGNAIFLCERDDNFEIIAVWAGIVGQDQIKADTWYTLKDGRPVEVDQ